ncbi:Na+/H+-dicarboxylate symporter [Novosphingobium chloroacetimidivorans]|uniref:Na+/H+-dicarboxylate symporter n=1 Tax=Novosphingobium chloroacetimidivorans TaxID=1428314 RepID=A0A7W7NVX1_9SPHN|nr:cation:dicarboxylase symporter family transporter [Novosphingobium chloroacetimidivorans]MBB4857779.1 Na+/H+-dicarboxylate symporter [Novosphingobium chloroacetimidivorans]
MTPTDTRGESSATRMPAIRVPAGLTFTALIAGIALGWLVSGSAIAPRLAAIAGPIGKLWLQGLTMTILPLVAALLFNGVTETVAAARAGAMARRTLGLIFGFLAISAILGGVLTPLLLRLFPVPPDAAAAMGAQSADPGPVPGVADFLGSLIPSNIVKAAGDNAMLPVIVFFALFALASTRLAEGPRRTLASLFEGIAGAMMVVIGWVLAIAPIGVFGLAFSVAAGSGTAAIGALAHYVVIVASIGGVMLLGAYPLAILGGRRKAGAFVRAMLPVQTVALSTQSSLASLPAMLGACRELGVRERTGEFVLPLAVALFRATGPGMNMAVAVYAAHLTGVVLTPTVIAAGVLTAFATSLGAVSLPGAISFVTSCGPVAIAMGVPVEPLALLVAVEMLPDLMRTVGNVTMDVAITSVVDRMEGEAEPARG